MSLRRLILAATILSSLSDSAFASDRVTVEQLLPRRTLAFLKVPNAADARQRWEASSFGTMQRDPAFQPFFADLARQIESRTTGIRRATGMSLAEIWHAFDGEVGAAIVHSPESGFAVVGAADLGGDVQAAGRRVAALEALLAARGAVAIPIAASGAKVVSWTIGADEEQVKFAWMLKGRHLVVSSDLGTLLGLAKQQAPRGDSEASQPDTLAGNPVYQHIVDETRAASGEPAFQWFVDPIGGLEAAIAANLGENPNRELIDGLLKYSGLQQLKGVGGSLELASPLADNVSRTFGYVEPPASGILQALQLPATRQAPPDWVADDTSLYMQVNWSGPRFYRAIEELFDSFRGAGAFRSFVESGGVEGSTMNLKSGLDQLVGPIHIAANMPASAGEIFKQPAVVAIGVADAGKSSETLRSIAASAGAQVESIGGRQVYTLRLDVPGVQAIELAVTVAEGSLMISTNPSYLRSVLSRDRRRPLVTSSAYRQATRPFPEKTSMLSYQRQDARFERLYETIRAGKLQLPLYGGIISGLGLDFSKLPPSSAARKYLQTSSSFIEPAEKGFRMIEIGFWPAERQRPLPVKTPEKSGTPPR